MTYFPGQLIPIFGVICGKCKDEGERIIDGGGEAHTPSEAREVLRRQGWEMTRAWGLICPNCANPVEEKR